MKLIFLLGTLLPGVVIGSEIELYPGYVSRIDCTGKLILTSIGNDKLVQIEPLPDALGCGLLLKPLQMSGTTNLVLESSSQSATAVVQVLDNRKPKSAKDLRYQLKGGK